MRARFQFSYGAALTEEQIIRLTPLLDKEITVDADGTAKTWETYEADIERVLDVLDGAATIELQGTADPRPILALHDELQAISLRLGRVSTEPATYVNHRVDVHVPGNALLFVNRVEVWTDLCTEELQGKLDDGWRIVAVCPQPDQRRPDYVLGRREDES